MTKKTLLSGLLAVALVGSAQAASVTFNITAEQLKTSTGDPMPLDGVIFIVASTLDSSFGTVDPGSYTASDFIGGTDDIILFRGDLNTNGAPGLFAEPVIVILDDGDATPGFVPGLSAGDPVSIYWFPTANNAGGAGKVALNPGDEGGMYQHPTGLDGSRAWTMPASGTHDLNFFTSDSPNVGGGSNDPATGFAQLGFVSIPEPSSLLSLLCGALLLLRRRR